MPEFIDSILKEHRVFYPHEEFSRRAHIKSMKDYSKIYKKSIENPEKFWAEKANELEWFRKWDTVFRDDMGFFKWFEGGEINASYNCLDRIIKSGKGKKTAFIWEAESGEAKTYTYEELLKEVCRFANVLKKKMIKAVRKIPPKPKINQTYFPKANPTAKTTREKSGGLKPPP